MTPPLTPATLGPTLVAFARLLRDMALAEGERRRVARPADVRGIRPAWQDASLPTELAKAFEDEVDAAEARLAPSEFEASGGIGLPPRLADRLMVVAAAPPGCGDRDERVREVCGASYQRACGEMDLRAAATPFIAGRFSGDPRP